MDAGSGFAVVAALIDKGEWTTYGDIAAAAGHPRRARMVGRAASTMDDFPNAHRVLSADGTVGRGTGPGGRNSAERARRLLEREGVGFSQSGRADPAARIYWDELQRRMDTGGEVSRRR